MATKGYHQYRGKGRGSKKLLVVLLLLILLGACTFLFLQKYIVYDSDGGMHLELPFGKDEETNPGTIPDSEIHIEREESPTPEPEPEPEPEPLMLTPLHAQELSYGCLRSDPSAVLKGQEAVVVNIKRSDGAIAYAATFALPDSISRGNKETTTHLQTITGSNCYTVARIAALCDQAYPAAKDGAGFVYSDGSLWRDNYNRLWLDPTSEETANYLCALAKECAQLGFDEILLDYLRFPIEGNLSQTTLGDTNRANAIAALVEKIREAVGPQVAVSVLLPGSLDSTYAFKASGLTAKVLAEHFDRVYVPQNSDAYFWLEDNLPAEFDRAIRLVLTSYGATEGSYMITQ